MKLTSCRDISTLEKNIQQKFEKTVDKFETWCYIAFVDNYSTREVIDTDNEILREKISESGLKKKYIISRLNLSYQGFDNKLAGKSEWLNREVDELCDMLHITDMAERRSIFL